MSAPIRFETPTMKKVNSPADIPVGRCFLIQFYSNETVYHEGDERSRTNPGHGYPAYTKSVQKVEQYVTLDEEEWKRAITALVQDSRTGFLALVCFAPQITKSVEVVMDYQGA